MRKISNKHKPTKMISQEGMSDEEVATLGFYNPETRDTDEANMQGVFWEYMTLQNGDTTKRIHIDRTNRWLSENMNAQQQKMFSMHNWGAAIPSFQSMNSVNYKYILCDLMSEAANLAPADVMRA